MNRKERFIKRIVKNFTKNGYKCSVKEGKIIVKDEERLFVISLSDAIGFWKRKVNIDFSFAFESMGNVQPLGLLWLASTINNNSKSITTRVWPDHFSCRFETAIYGFKDFFKEFVFAYKELGETYSNIVNKYNEVKTNFSNEIKERRPIGFMARRYMQEENSEVCKLVAQTNCNFAADNKNDLYMKELKKKADNANRVEKQYCDYIRKAAEAANIAESEYAKQKRVSKQKNN